MRGVSGPCGVPKIVIVADAKRLTLSMTLESEEKLDLFVFQELLAPIEPVAAAAEPLDDGLL